METFGLFLGVYDVEHSAVHVKYFVGIECPYARCAAEIDFVVGVAAVKLHEESTDVALHVQIIAQVEVGGGERRLRGGCYLASAVELRLALV